jgi:membrane protease YdiL (CAAX protease family)
VVLYLFGYLGGVLATQVPIGFLYVAYLGLTGTTDLSALQAALQPDRLPLWLYLALKVAEVVVLLVLTYVCCRWLDRRRFVALGFHFDRSAVLDVLLGLGLAGLQMLAIFCVELGNGWLIVQLPGASNLLHRLAGAVLAVVLFVFVAVGEELMYRGYLLVNLLEGTTALLALVLTSLLFGAFHALNPNFGWLPWANIVLAGLAIGYSRWVTGNLWLPIAYHLAWNLSQGILGLPVSGVRYGPLLTVVDQSPTAWLSGASFGPEGGLVGTVALLSSFPMFWLWGRWRRRMCLSAGGQA